MPEPMDSPIVQALRALTGRTLFPQAPPPSQPVNAPFSPPASSWAEVQADPLKALANLVMGAVDPWGQPKGMNTGSIGGLLGAALPLASLARGAEAGVAARGTQAARGAEEAAPGIRAYHGSPHDFDNFALEKIGTGEGAQAYGHGLYFAENEGVARNYRNALSARTAGGHELPDYLSMADPIRDRDMFTSTLQRMNEQLEKWRVSGADELDYMQGAVEDAKRTKAAVESALADAASIGSKGRMYEVQINANPDHLLDWDKPLSQQSETVRGASQRLIDKAKQDAVNNKRYAAEALLESPEYMPADPTGSDLHRVLSRTMNDGAQFNQTTVSKALREQGIPGIKYLDGGSRAAGEGSRNYVIFDDSLITILKKYGVALPMIEALRRKAAANNGRLPADDVHGAIQS